MKTEIRVINSFSINETGGNPAGVVLNADHLTTAQKQMIAAKAGFPETAFVSASKVADFKLDFFTPLKQIPHCGHATIATFSFLKQQGIIQGEHSSKETIDGCRAIVFRDGEAFMEQQRPSFIKFKEVPQLLDALHISPEDLSAGLYPTIVHTGNAFLIVPVSNEKILSEINYDRQAVNDLSERYGLIGLYLYTPKGTMYDVTTRMFAPFYGIDEEAATGMAAGPLAAYLYQIAGNKKADFIIEQGRFMRPASPSLIRVQVDVSEGLIQKIFAGGAAYVSGTVVIEL